LPARSCNAKLSRPCLGQTEHHQDRRRLAGPVRPEQAEHLALDNVEVDGTDNADRAIALGQAARGDDDVAGRHDRLAFWNAHRRPNLATAPSIRSSAIPMTPAPTIPHTVEIDTVMRNWPEAFSPREVALTEVM
jgi:hypothetical protein